MRKDEKTTLLALCIGDGYLNQYIPKGRKATVTTLRIIHSVKQKEYLEWKANILHSILGGNKPIVHEFNNSGYPGVRLQKSNPYFRILRKYLYKNNRKIIPLKALERMSLQDIAIWWMDDGCLFPKKRNGKIHAWELYLNTYLTDDENQVIINFFKEKFGITWRINHDKGKSRLRCSTREGRNFLNLIRSYVTVECMKYKVINI